MALTIYTNLTTRAAPLLAVLLAAPAAADIYSYMNADGDYIVSRERPESASEYAVLTDDGEFIRLVSASTLRVPVTHWRPWYMPKDPNPLDPPKLDERAEPNVIIEEVDEGDDDNE